MKLREIHSAILKLQTACFFKVPVPLKNGMSKGCTKTKTKTNEQPYLKTVPKHHWLWQAAGVWDPAAAREGGWRPCVQLGE